MSDILSRTEYRISVLEDLVREFAGEVRALRSELIRERRTAEFERPLDQQCLGCLHLPHVANTCHVINGRGERCLCDEERTRDPGSIYRTKGKKGVRCKRA